MSMNVGGDGGVHRPLGPQVQPQQPQVKQPAVGNNHQSHQGKPGQAGRALHKINSFNSQPVSNDLQHLQQWLNNLKGGGPAPARPQPQSLQGGDRQLISPGQTVDGPPMVSDLQMAQVNARQKAIASESDPRPSPAPTLSSPEGSLSPLPLSADQKKVLKEGLDKLEAVHNLPKADIARLAHARASGNEGLYFFQLGKLDIPPGSAAEQQLKAGFDDLFKQVNSVGSTIANEIKPTLVLDDVSRLAASKSINLPPALVVDLGALTNNETDRFIALAQATGVPQGKAETLLRGFEALGKQYDLSSSELDAMLGEAARTVNTEITVQMDNAAKSLNLPPPLFNDLANATLTKDPKAFAAIGEQGGLSKAQLKGILPKITKTLSDISKSPVLSREKLQRFTKDTSIQNQIYSAGKEFGLTQPQSLKLAAAYVDTDLSGYVKLADEYGLGRNASKLLNKLEAIETRQGTNALSLATNNYPDIVEQRVLAKELGLQARPVEWPTTKPAPFKPPGRGAFDFLSKVGSMTPPPDTSKADAAAKAEAAARAKNEVRLVKLVDELKQVRGQIKKLAKAMRNPFFVISNPKAKGKMKRLKSQEKAIRTELDKIQKAGHVPSPNRAKEIKLLDELGNLKDKLRNVRNMMQKKPFTQVFYKPVAGNLKRQIQAIESQLNKIRA